MAERNDFHPSDDDLLDVLRLTFSERTEPSDSMVEMIMTGYDITNADASLAKLMEDTRLEDVASVRATADQIRLLTFSTDSFAFEFELRPTEPQLVGHILGADEGTELYLEQAAHVASVQLGASGQFEFALRDHSPFRLRHTTLDGRSTATEWVLP